MLRRAVTNWFDERNDKYWNQAKGVKLKCIKTQKKIGLKFEKKKKRRSVDIFESLLNSVQWAQNKCELHLGITEVFYKTKSGEERTSIDTQQITRIDADSWARNIITSWSDYELIAKWGTWNKMEPSISLICCVLNWCRLNGVAL